VVDAKPVFRQSNRAAPVPAELKFASVLTAGVVCSFALAALAAPLRATARTIAAGPRRRLCRWVDRRPSVVSVTPTLIGLSPIARRVARRDVADDQPHSPVFFECDNIGRTHRELSERGIEFPMPATKMEFRA
jgi:hypothetical protein